MPRLVDHQTRRAELVDAALAVIRDEGVETLSVRSLARVSGWSSGAVRHYVPDANAMARLLQERVSADVQASVRAILGRPGALDGPAEVRDGVIACLCRLLPLDAPRQVEFEVWRHFWGRNRSGPDAAWVWQGQRAFYRQLVLLLDGRGLSPDIAPTTLNEPLEAWAGHLHAVVDGLALRAALEVPAVHPDDLRAAVTHAVDVIIRDLASGQEAS